MDGRGAGTRPVTELRRSLGFWGGTAIIVGTVIGSGIFRVPGSIASHLESGPAVLGLWLAFAAITLCGALTLAELATLLPHSGGTYVYLRAGFGDGAAFVLGWLYLLVTTPAGMGALATFFAELLLEVLGIPLGHHPWLVPGLAAASIALLSLANVVGVRLGTAIQKAFTVIKLVAVLAVIVLGFVAGGDASRWTAGAPEGTTLAGLGAAAGLVMFTYNGWIYIGLVAGEIQEPERRLKPIILAGTLTVIGVYLAANLAYLYVLSFPEMKGKVAAREILTAVAGPRGAALITAGIMASVFGALNGVILTRSRVPFALSRDGLTFSILGRTHPTRATPHVAILVQAAVAVVLVFALRDPDQPRRLFDRISTYYVSVEWTALVLAMAAVFVLRRTRPDAPRPFRVPLYPFVPLGFVVGTSVCLAAIVWSSCARGDWSPVFGLGIALAGLPVYWIWSVVKQRR
jgi:amino acid transporter